MATKKKPVEETPETPESVEANTALFSFDEDTRLAKYGTKSVVLPDVEPHFIYWLVYGIKKSQQDSVAGLKKKLMGEGLTEAEADAKCLESAYDRWDKVMSGELGVRDVTARLPSRDRLARQKAESDLRKICKKRGESMPKGKELTARLVIMVEKNPKFYEWADQELADEADDDFDYDQEGEAA